MPLLYKIDILAALNDKGYSSYKLIQDNILSSGTVQKLRHGQPVSWQVLERLCDLLDCQPSALIGYVHGRPNNN